MSYKCGLPIDAGAAQGVELLDRHIYAVHCAVGLPSGIEGHHPVDDAARQVARVEKSMIVYAFGKIFSDSPTE